MSRLVPALIVAGVVLFIFFVMWNAWRKRKKNAAAVAPAQALADASAQSVATITDLFYVATTLVGKPLDRVAVRGLSYRGKAEIDVYEQGIVIRVTGELPVAVEATSIRSVAPQQLTIDKVVEKGGLTAITWQSELGELSTVFRVKNPAAQQQLHELNAQFVHPPVKTKTSASNAQEKK